MELLATVPNPREKDLLKEIHARIPVVVVRHAVEGGIERSVVIPPGAVYPDRRPVEGH